MAAGEVYDVTTLRPRRMYVCPASYIGNEGVEPILILEVEGEHEGKAFKFALEFAPATGKRVGESLVKYSGETTHDVNDLALLIMATTAFNMGIGARVDREQSTIDELNGACERTRIAAGIVFESPE